MSTFIEHVFKSQRWFIAYRTKKPLDTLLNMEGFQIIKPPSGRFYADPFVIEQKGKNYIFFEEFIEVKHKGVISYIELDDQGNLSNSKIALEKNHHLSYPFIFEMGGIIYMVPETGENQTIELYEAVKFPDQWKLKKILMSGKRAVDTTILFHNNKTWLFTTILEPEETRGRGTLHVFYADSLFSDWISHPRNPVDSDLNLSRSAGNIFFHQGKLIRPSQNCLEYYGQALIFNEITCLNEHDYQEKRLMEISPDWISDNRGFHTYNFNSGIEVIDGLFISTDFLRVIRRVIAIFRGLLNI